MIAFLLALLNKDKKQTSQPEESFIVPKAERLAVYRVRPHEYSIVKVTDASNVDFNIKNLNFSSSGEGKVEVVKNGCVISTLFIGKLSRNVPYHGTLEVKKGDSIEFFLCNKEIYSSLDMYVGFDV